LRLPGQWEDTIWQDASLGVPLYHNGYRWYGVHDGRFTRPDIVGYPPLFQIYGYAEQRPLYYADPNGALTQLGPYIPIIGPLKCLASGITPGFQIEQKGAKWVHCVASCNLKKCGGEQFAENLGNLKEAFDGAACLSLISTVRSSKNKFCKSAYQRDDYEDNEFGRQCPEDIPCEKHCEELSGDGAPGPLNGFPPEIFPGLIRNYP
jgi:RHS repeat-associated protein